MIGIGGQRLLAVGISAGVIGVWLMGVGLLANAALITPAAAAAGTPEEEQQERLMQRYEKMVQFNLDNDRALPSTVIDSLMARFQHFEVGERIAAWADHFWRRGDAKYLFGLAPDGYVSKGRLVDDFRTDCVLFFYRTTELGRSSSAVEAVQFAFGTRFYGATLEEVVRADGGVDYDSPVHLDYTVDIIRSGIWGQEITELLGSSVADEAGSSRYESGSVRFVPKKTIAWEKLQSGDIVYFVSDETTDSGKKLRKIGAIIGHLGIVRIEGGQIYLMHAASKGLEGLYQGGKIEKVALRTYLERVESFKGIMITRIENF